MSTSGIEHICPTYTDDFVSPIVRYVIAYDIASPIRLRRVARLLERRAIRTQKSVFLFDGPEVSLIQLLDELAVLINVKEDVVQAWPLGTVKPEKIVVRGTPAVITPAAAVLHDQELIFVKGRGI